MPPQTHHQRTQTLLLIQKILSKPESSPLTLVLDSVEQGAAGLVKVVVGVAKASKTHTIYISPTPLNAPPDIDTHITSRRKTPDTLRREILASIPQNQKTLLILSPLPPSLFHPPQNLPTYLLSLLSPSTSMFLIHHVDIPIPIPTPNKTPYTSPPSNPQPQQSPYTPAPLPLLLYTATTILTLSSLPQHLALKRAQDTALAAPLFGLEEGREGVLVGRGANVYSHFHSQGKGGMIISMDHRRKSGRSVTETFFLPSPSPSIPTSPSSSPTSAAELIKRITLLDTHPLFAASAPTTTGQDFGLEGGDIGATFELGLSAKQRRDREGVVLPYYDAQQRWGDGGGEGSGGEGGRILYEMGAEDDFDEEEDEV